MPMMRRRNPPTGFEVTRLRVESRHQMLKWDDRSYLNEPAAASEPLHTASGGPLAAAECTRVRYEVGTKESHLGNCLVFSSVEPPRRPSIQLCSGNWHVGKATPAAI